MNNKTGSLKCNNIETFQDYVIPLFPLLGLGGQPGYKGTHQLCITFWQKIKS